MKHKIIFITLLALMLILWVIGGSMRTFATTTAVRYVSPAGSDSYSNTCTNSANPCRTLAHAIDVSSDGDTINLAAGVYYENPNLAKSLTINGADANTVFLDGGGSAADNGSVVTIYSGPTVTISNLTIRNGYDSGAGVGGGIINNGNLTLNTVVISGNTAAQGGGIYNNGPLTMNNTAIRGNTASGTGGLINRDTAVIQNSEISGNVSTGSSDTGGIHNNDGATMSLTNVTISGNSGSGGAGIFNGGTLTALNVTVAGNGDSNSAGGIGNYGTATFTNSLIAENGGAVQCFGTGTFTSGGYNLESGNSCGFNQTSDLPDSAARIRPLADNSGDTKTHALQANSPAMDAANNGSCPATDQRGVSRPIDSNENGTAVCDIGAFEYNPATDKTKNVYLPLVTKP